MRYSGLIKSGKILAFGKNGAVGAVTYGMTGIMLPTGAFVSGETIMTAAMTTGYTMTGSNMLVKVNDSMAGLTRTNMMAGLWGRRIISWSKGHQRKSVIMCWSLDCQIRDCMVQIIM